MSRVPPYINKPNFRKKNTNFSKKNPQKILSCPGFGPLVATLSYVYAWISMFIWSLISVEGQGHIKVTCNSILIYSTLPNPETDIFLKRQKGCGELMWASSVSGASSNLYNKPRAGQVWNTSKRWVLQTCCENGPMTQSTVDFKCLTRGAFGLPLHWVMAVPSSPFCQTCLCILTGSVAEWSKALD